MSLAEHCREVASRYPYMVEGMREDVVNYRALARKIRPEVEEHAGRDVDIEAVTTAVRRYGEQLQDEGGDDVEAIREVLAGSRVSLRGNVVSITAETVDDVSSGSGFFHMVRGRSYTTVVVDDTRAEEVRDDVSGVVEEKTDLTCITVESPDEIVEVPGVLAHLVSRFTSEEINIVDITSCYTETIIVVEKRAAVDALETIEDVIAAAEATV